MRRRKGPKRFRVPEFENEKAERGQRPQREIHRENYLRIQGHHGKSPPPQRIQYHHETEVAWNYQRHQGQQKQRSGGLTSKTLKITHEIEARSRVRADRMEDRKPSRTVRYDAWLGSEL